jgi:hypothetical protein
MFTRATQCVRGVLDPPVSVFSLSLYRHPFLYTLFSSRFTLIINNEKRCRDIEFCLTRECCGSCVFVRITHEHIGSRSDPSITGHSVHYPNDLDIPPNETNTDKIWGYRTDYDNRPSNTISFMSVIPSTSGDYTENLCEFYLYKVIGKLSETDRFREVYNFRSSSCTIYQWLSVERGGKSTKEGVRRGMCKSASCSTVQSWVFLGPEWTVQVLTWSPECQQRTCSTVQSWVFLAPEWAVQVLTWSSRVSTVNFVKPQVESGSSDRSGIFTV